MALQNLHICTGSTLPSLRHRAISTETKCAGSFGIFFALNQPKLDML